MGWKRQEKEPSEKTQAELFDTFVSNIGYHCGCLHRESGKFCASAVHGMECVRIFIEPKVEGEIDIWDQCYLCDEDWNRIECLGNRCGAEQHYSKVAGEALRRFATEMVLNGVRGAMEAGRAA